MIVQSTETRIYNSTYTGSLVLAPRAGLLDTYPQRYTKSKRHKWMLLKFKIYTKVGHEDIPFGRERDRNWSDDLLARLELLPMNGTQSTAPLPII
jgi:hypothetical protein